MKMKNMVPGPETFLQGVGQYTYESMLDGLGWLGMDTEDVLATLSGLGQARTQSTGLMTAIVGNAAEMNSKMAALAAARSEAARKDPMFASALKQAKQKTAAPGSNVAKGVVKTMNDAAQKATKAKQAEQKAKVLIKQNDKRAAAASAVNALTAAREAATLANRAEKTRLATNLDSVANTLEAQARYLDGVAAREAAMTGQSVRTTMLAATGLNLRQEAKKLRNRSALVAAQPDVPPQAPPPQRIADLANRFNIRTAARDRFMQNRALVSVLGDLSDDPMAQAPDYNGALAYYGNDDMGRLMADIEFDNENGAIMGLSRAVNGIGYTDTLPVYEVASQTLAEGQALARQAYKTAVLPAAGLGGLGLHPRLFMESDAKWFGVEPPAKNRGDKWDRWCATTYAGNQAEIDKCQNPGIGCDAVEPWSAAGKLCRGNTDIGGAVAQVVQDVTSGKAFQSPPKLPNLQIPGLTRGNALPPAVIPPAQLPPAVTQQTQQAAQAAQASYSYGAAARGIPTYVYAIGGVAVLGAAYLFMMPKSA